MDRFSASSQTAPTRGEEDDIDKADQNANSSAEKDLMRRNDKSTELEPIEKTNKSLPTSSVEKGRPGDKVATCSAAIRDQSPSKSTEKSIQTRSDQSLSDSTSTREATPAIEDSVTASLADHETASSSSLERTASGDSRILEDSAANKVTKAPRGKSTSKYRGVCWLKRRRAWRARIEVQGRRIHLGYFNTEEAAGLAYDERAIQLNGPGTQLNFPERFSNLSTASVITQNSLEKELAMRQISARVTQLQLQQLEWHRQILQQHQQQHQQQMAIQLLNQKNLVSGAGNTAAAETGASAQGTTVPDISVPSVQQNAYQLINSIARNPSSNYSAHLGMVPASSSSIYMPGLGFLSAGMNQPGTAQVPNMPFQMNGSQANLNLFPSSGTLDYSASLNPSVTTMPISMQNTLINLPTNGNDERSGKEHREQSDDRNQSERKKKARHK